MAENPEKNVPPGRSRGADLARALVAGEFFLVYQPVLDLSRGRFTGVEALMRWRHDGAVLAPADFLDELETSGLITAVGRWALATACHQTAEWHSRGYRLNVSVNVARRQLHSGSLVDDVAVALAASHLAPPWLIVEVSANDARSDEATSVLSELHELGVRVAIDDVDPARDTLDALTHGPLSVVKLDRHAVARLATPAAMSRLHEFLQRASELDVNVVATGVEEDAQHQLLKGEHVSAAQGFLFSQPREASAIDDYLRDFSILSGEPL